MTSPVQSVPAPSASLPTDDRGTGPTVLFVHGWAASRLFWRDVITALAERFRGVAVDLPGFGDANREAAPYTIAHYTEVVADLARRYGAGIVVAHSMGGMIAAKWASERPDGLRRLVLVNAPVAGPEALRWKSRVLLWPVIRWFSYWICRIRWFRRWVARDFVFKKELPEDLLEGILRPGYAATIGSVRSLQATDLRGEIGRIAVPTLVVGTDRDLVIRREQFEVAAAGIPGARLAWISDCGHVPMVEKTEEFVKILGEFLAA